MTDMTKAARVHWTEVDTGFRVWAHGTLFALTDTGADVRTGGHGCTIARCHHDHDGCIESGDPRSSHAVIVREAVAVTEPSPQLRGFVEEIGDSWRFQIRGDLAYFTESSPGSGEYGAP